MGGFPTYTHSPPFHALPYCTICVYIGTKTLFQLPPVTSEGMYSIVIGESWNKVSVLYRYGSLLLY